MLNDTKRLTLRIIHVSHALSCRRRRLNCKVCIQKQLSKKEGEKKKKKKGARERERKLASSILIHINH
jgi:hypothetical protein